MIISHKHRFIFLKTKKTAGSSIEYALANLCGDDDVITVASKNEEPNRPGRRGQNYWLPWSKRRPVEMVRSFFTDTPERYVGFYNHMPARRVRQIVGDDIWRSYFKFAFERNPWDRQVSLYFWRYRDPETRPSFEDFIKDPRKVRKARNWSIYSIDGRIAVDEMGRFETLLDDLNSILQRLDLPVDPELPKLKVTREAGRGYREFYTDETRDIVGGWYAREIEAFGYEF